MGKHVHILTNVNLDNKTANCSNCGDVSIKLKGKDRRGNISYRCLVAYRAQKRAYKSPWRYHLGPVCEWCGFIPEHKCQLDIDHINGIKSDNSPENLQTLCANCHRLKTYLNNDWKNKSLADTK